MAAMTRQNVIDLARALLNATGDLNWSDATMIVLADAANRFVMDLLCASDPAWVATRTSFVWAANTERVDLTSAGALNAEPKKIIDVYETPSSGAPSDSNRSTPWTAIGHTARHRRQGYYPRRHIAPSSDVAWSLAGNYMYASPVPASARNLHVEWVPQATALSASSTEVLSGQGEQFGDTVALYLAVLMNMKDNHNPSVRDSWADQEDRIKVQAGIRQSQRVRVVGSEGRA
ncbi:MAG: hypothetical protein A3E78_08760 [Alphaproteobacteria bacterium RIFCSPHIGHO2_12_FULL_63_12]|nr:MAG: hypothetical protein A3E78_08760 [Alphaproteobacteria bacterium RIFCSPHIGHO2_12_FULL_63_12]